jgi:hypothetical protein
MDVAAGQDARAVCLADQPKQGCDLAIVLDKQNKDAVALRNSPEEIDDRPAAEGAGCGRLIGREPVDHHTHLLARAPRVKSEAAGET